MASKKNIELKKSPFFKRIKDGNCFEREIEGEDKKRKDILQHETKSGIYKDISRQN